MSDFRFRNARMRDDRIFDNLVTDSLATRERNQVQVVSALPAPVPEEGRAVLLTTDGSLYVSSGTAWVAAAASEWEETSTNLVFDTADNTVIAANLTVPVVYRKNGSTVIMEIQAASGATTNNAPDASRLTTSPTGTGVPVGLRPQSDFVGYSYITDSGTDTTGRITITAAGVVGITKFNDSVFTPFGTLGVKNFTVSYSV